MELKNFNFKQKLCYHPEQLIALRGGKRPFPVTMELDLTNICNHNCYFCVVKKLREQHQVSLDTEAALRAIRGMREMGTKGISFTGGGEPLVHQDFYKILKETHRLGIDTGLMTNGSLIREERIGELLEHLTWMRISVGAGNSKLYRRIQGRDDYERVVDNIRAVGNYRRKKGVEVNIGVRMLLDPDNYHSLPQLARDLAESHIDYIQVAPDCRDEKYPILHVKDIREVLRQTEEILEGGRISLLLAGFTQDQNERLYPKKCYAHFFQMALTATGDLVFCKNVRGKETMAIGNIYQNSVKEIWEGGKAQELEDQICPGECKEICKNMQVNVAIEQFLNPTSDMSVNFVG